MLKMSKHEQSKRKDFKLANLGMTTIEFPLPPVITGLLLYDIRGITSRQIVKLTNCKFDFQSKKSEKIVLVTGNSLKMATYGVEELKNLTLKFAASNRAPSWVKTVSLLTQLHDRQAIQLIPFVKNGGKGQHQISKSYRFEIETAELSLQKFGSHITKCKDYVEHIKASLKDALTSAFKCDDLKKTDNAEFKFEVRFGWILWHLRLAHENVEEAYHSTHLTIMELRVGNAVSLKRLSGYGSAAAATAKKEYFSRKCELADNIKHTFLTDVYKKVIDLKQVQGIELGRGTLLTIQILLLDMPIKDGAFPVATLTCERLGNRYQLVDVSAKLGRKAVIDCIRFEGILDMRIALFYSSLDYPEDFSKSKDSARVLVDLIEESKNGELRMPLRHDKFAVMYVSRRHRVVYQHNFDGRPYFITLIDSEEGSEVDLLDQLMQVNPDNRKEKITLRLKQNSYMTLQNPQWLLDFAYMKDTEASVENLFERNSCRPPEGFQMKPKIPTVESVLEELDHFMNCALSVSSQ